jgi:hypothetical protein
MADIDEARSVNYEPVQQGIYAEKSLRHSPSSHSHFADHQQRGFRTIKQRIRIRDDIVAVGATTLTVQRFGGDTSKLPLHPRSRPVLSQRCGRWSKKTALQRPRESSLTG